MEGSELPNTFLTQFVSTVAENLSTSSFQTDIAEDDDLTEEEEYIFDRYSVRVVFIVLYSIVFFLCVIGNLIVLLVATLHWQMRHVTKFCMANLAFADFCVGVFCVYQNLSTYLISSWFLGEFLCKMYQYIDGLSHTASILTLMVVSVERYLAIVHPLHCRRIMTRNRIRIVVATVWFASGLYCSPRLYYMVTLEVPSWDGLNKEIICTARRTLYDSRTFDMINSVLLFLLPLILMVVLYFRMGLVLWRSTGSQLHFTIPSISVTNSSGEALSETDSPSSQSHIQTSHAALSQRSSNLSEDVNYFESESPNDNDTPRESESERRKSAFIRSSSVMPIFGWRRKKDEENPSPTETGMSSRRIHRSGSEDVKTRQSVVKMMIVIVLVFAMCHLPYHLKKIAVYWWPNFDLGSVHNTLALPVTHLCMYANCAINPIIYAFMSSSFRACLKDLVRCRLKRPTRIQCLKPLNVSRHRRTEFVPSD